MQLPFLQHSLPQSRIVPILLQDDSLQNVNRLSESIAHAIGETSVLLLGSADLCHYPAYEEAIQSDQVVLDAMRRFDTDVLRNRIAKYLKAHKTANLHCLMCSTGAVYTMTRPCEKQVAVGSIYEKLLTQEMYQLVSEIGSLDIWLRQCMLMNSPTLTSLR